MLLDALLALLALPAVLATGYLLLLTAASRRRAPPDPPGRHLRFDVVVPAHDEEAGIGRTVESLLALEWPRERFRVVVVADNCGDATAARAAAAGAVVLERTDPTRRGKGHALDFAFTRVLEAGLADAVVVVDADSVASPGLLAAFAARLGPDAQALQASYRVLNPRDSWRTRLMTVAFALVNEVRPLGRQGLGLSCGLKGNGMCLAAEVLRRVPHRAFSIVEDLEYALHLAEAGVRVHYVWEASVHGEMVSTAAASRPQRQRWERGRGAVARARAWPTLRRGLARRDPVLLDLAADLLLPPLALVACYVAAGTAAAGALLATGHVDVAALVPWAASCLFLGAYLLRGLHLSGLGLAGGAAALCWAPVYLAWKVAALRAGPRLPADWVRTEREHAPKVRPP
jgi:1,2-diacylglycerol 3-beta-glucosyltransferase